MFVLIGKRKMGLAVFREASRVVRFLPGHRPSLMDRRTRVQEQGRRQSDGNRSVLLRCSSGQSSWNRRSGQLWVTEGAMSILPLIERRLDQIWFVRRGSSMRVSGCWMRDRPGVRRLWICRSTMRLCIGRDGTVEVILIRVGRLLEDRWYGLTKTLSLNAVARQRRHLIAHQLLRHVLRHLGCVPFFEFSFLFGVDCSRRRRTSPARERKSNGQSVGSSGLV